MTKIKKANRVGGNLVVEIIATKKEILKFLKKSNYRKVSRIGIKYHLKNDILYDCDKDDPRCYIKNWEDCKHIKCNNMNIKEVDYAFENGEDMLEFSTIKYKDNKRIIIWYNEQNSETYEDILNNFAYNVIDGCGYFPDYIIKTFKGL